MPVCLFAAYGMIAWHFAFSHVALYCDLFCFPVSAFPVFQQCFLMCVSLADTSTLVEFLPEVLWVPCLTYSRSHIWAWRSKKIVTFLSFFPALSRVSPRTAPAARRGVCNLSLLPLHVNLSWVIVSSNSIGWRSIDVFSRVHFVIWPLTLRESNGINFSLLRRILSTKLMLIYSIPEFTMRTCRHRTVKVSDN